MYCPAMRAIRPGSFKHQRIRNLSEEIYLLEQLRRLRNTFGQRKMREPNVLPLGQPAHNLLKAIVTDRHLYTELSLRALDAEPTSGDRLHHRVSGRYHQYLRYDLTVDFNTARCQQQYTTRLRCAGQIVEVARLAILEGDIVFPVALGGAENDANGASQELRRTTRPCVPW